MDKTIRKVTDLEEQQAETYRYWASRPVAERLAAVCELSESAFAFKERFKGVPVDADCGRSRTASPRPIFALFPSSSASGPPSSLI
jgi:hypothetical protein